MKSSNFNTKIALAGYRITGVMVTSAIKKTIEPLKRFQRDKLSIKQY